LANDLILREISRLESQLNDLLFENAPNVERDIGQLELRAETARRIFSDLDERFQTERNRLGGNKGSVRIWDEALVPKKPISPSPLLALVAATLATLFCYVVYLTLRSALSTVISDQESLERATGLPVFMNIPRSNAQKRIASAPAIVDPRRMLPGSGSDDTPLANVLAVKRPDDYSVENLRGLRSMLEPDTQVTWPVSGTWTTGSRQRQIRAQRIGSRHLDT